jgi:ABC-type branched-subunit amino acid transport system substrate-binding protein
MVRVGRIVAFGVVVLALGLASAAVSAAPSAHAADSPSEIGVTAKTIRIAVIADVDNSIIPGLFQPTVDGVWGAVKLINGNGGIAGRKLVIDFIDSKLNPTEARNAIIKACQQDFAMVGTAAVFLSVVTDLTTCPNSKGEPIGIPDFGAVVAGTPEACAPTSFPLLGAQVICDTRDSHPQRYQGYRGAGRYLVKKYGNLHGAYVSGNDSADIAKSSQVLELAMQSAGVKADQDAAVSSRDPQSVYTPIVAKMKQDGSNFAYGGAQPLAFRQEAALQGLSSDVVWLCNSTCYSTSFAEGGSASEGEYVSLPFLPFEDAGKDQAVTTFVKAVGKDKVENLSLYGYAATLVFRDALEKAVGKDGSGSVTRAAVIDGAKSLHAFNAGGLVGTTDIGNKKISSCFVLIQLHDGKWSRVWPKKAGGFDCDPANYVSIKHDFG